MISFYHLTIPLVRRKRALFDDVSLAIQQGDFAEIVGPVGAGKSVLFSLMSLRQKAASAKSIIGGRNLDRLDAGGVAELRQTIGSCAQQPKFLEQRSVIENLILPLVAREQSDGALDTVETLIDGTHLAALTEVPAGGLSAAERRLLAIFRALVGQPALVVIDGGLEGLADLREDARAAIASAHDAGSTIVLLGREVSGFDARRTVLLRIADAGVEESRVESSSSADPSTLADSSRQEATSGSSAAEQDLARC